MHCAHSNRRNWWLDLLVCGLLNVCGCFVVVGESYRQPDKKATVDMDVSGPLFPCTAWVSTMKRSYIYIYIHIGIPEAFCMVLKLADHIESTQHCHAY